MMQKAKSSPARHGNAKFPLGEIRTIHIDVKLSLSDCHECVMRNFPTYNPNWLHFAISLRPHRLHLPNNEIPEVYNTENAKHIIQQIKKLNPLSVA